MKKEKYIIERHSTKQGHTTEIVSFVVLIPYKENGVNKKYNKCFPVKDYYGKRSEALKVAMNDRDIMLPILREISTSKTVEKRTVKELYNAYKEHHSASLRTYRNYDSLMRTYIVSDYGDKDITEITEDDVLDSLNKCATNCCSRNISKLKTLWYRIFKQAHKNGINVYDQTLDVDLPKSEKDFNNAKKRQKNITEEDFQIFIDCARTYGVIPESNSRRLYNRKIIADMLVVMRETGVRPAEAKAIHKSNISFSIIDGNEIATIQIVSSIGSTNTEMITEKEPKTATSYRPVYMYENLDVLKDVLSYSKYDLIFSDYDGNPFGVDWLSDYIHRVSKKCGIKFNMYLLRHSYNSDLYASHTQPVVIKELNGHANEKMSMDTYATSDKTDRIRAVIRRKKLRKSTNNSTN